MDNDTQFEFDETQNELVGDLAKKMSFVGLLLLFMGILNLIAGGITIFSNVEEGISNLVGGVIFALIGFWTRNASASFTQIVDTEGEDVSNLMTALGELRKLYALQYWTILVALILVLLVFIAGFVVAMSGA
jgi:hypothetical protein